MNYTLYCLEFINGVHFGRGNLDSSEITFHADTLFSALFQEALKMKKISSLRYEDYLALYEELKEKRRY